MKISFLIIVVSFTLVGCNEDDSGDGPLGWNVFVSFIDTEGNDFFDGQTDYNREEVFWYYLQETPNDIIILPLSERRHDVMIDGDSVITYSLPPISFLCLSFGNGDIDTLTYDFESSGTTDTRNALLIPEYLRKYSVLRYYYNGELVQTYDFESDPDLIFDLVQRNSHGLEGMPPYIIYLPKEPDPDEFVN